MRRSGLGAILAGTVAALGAYLSAFAPGGAPPWAAWAMTGAIVLLGGGFTLLAGGTASRRRWVLLAAGLLVAVLGGAFGAALVLPPGEPAAAPLWFGLPRRAALVIYGIGLLPAVALPLCYAAAFREGDASHDTRDVARSGPDRRGGAVP